MNLHDFEYFNTLGNLLSFTAAAKYSGVSQPTITYAVKRLEKHYDCDLIYKDPSHRTVALTNEGKVLKMHIENILDELALIERAIEHSKNKQIPIGFPPIIRVKILTQLLQKKENIDFIANFNFISGGSEELLAKLLSGHIDFSLIGSITPLNHPNLIVKQLYEREFYIFVSKNNPLALREEISFGEALEYPFILLDENYVHMEAFRNLNEKYHKKAKILLSSSDIQTTGQLVKSNVGITLMTDFLPFADMEGLVKVPLIAEDKQTFHVQYSYLKNAFLSEKLQELILLLDGLDESKK
ncbi:LysR family transcriptional regulator [Enterococcus xiangfangensis]|uniref:LysR family transcriptional regulator n=1 Tax=Enterococcus xiangfangensis TaxID=1296537 RepID=A0ABU3FDB8_9ENTE|nr:LysR family transcriptional regulator [Enterococcus xiangfangensis]MBM7711765.1 DNA-binding transcriptional LysR family regulator [Enterococcus xiangfangensis]MDT2760680.1 LysR family transcriptional regulator [Enterococcus xiangfangensis]NBK07505.1 LysR family transcriptional regulator [Enterococcus asini]